MRALLRATVFGLAFGFAGMSGASAMPVSNLIPAAKEISTGIQDVRWVCRPLRCWWQPNFITPYYGYRYWGPRRFAYRWDHRRWRW
jgi:hypothetical protein